MNKNALIVIDMIRDFTDPDGKVYFETNEAIIPAVNKLIDTFRQHNALIYFIRHIVKEANVQTHKGRICCVENTEGDEFDKRLHVTTADKVITKEKYSAFYQTELNDILHKIGVKNLVLCGVKTNNCVLATALDGYNEDYNVLIASDCVATDDNAVNQIYLHDLNRYIGTVKTGKEITDMIFGGE